jgi:membrane associated rhomboid family serine protease
MLLLAGIAAHVVAFVVAVLVALFYRDEARFQRRRADGVFARLKHLASNATDPWTTPS